MTWTELVSASAEDAYRVTDGLMSLVSDRDLDWKPQTGTNWMTTGQLLMHLTNACGFCCQGFVTGDWGMPEGKDAAEMPEDEMLPPAEKLPRVASVAEARRLLAADREIMRRMLAEAGEERLENERSAPPWEPGMERRLGEHLLDMVMHLNQHKGQLFYYLKLQGKNVNTMHLWRG
ncbi:MAG TPA: DinB family protein [Candidatus Krumholzibacteria bacterium]|nr:DinB family protein [Candidatus Krumholzibacteria bacterium]HPD71675.1 DinB family protein [Candidatus Krumholzibacteria bacterium]HRY41392.1 DinB family protein [Candidatus Krumholzibacteria bacterium]